MPLGRQGKRNHNIGGGGQAGLQCSPGLVAEKCGILVIVSTSIGLKIDYWRPGSIRCAVLGN